MDEITLWHGDCLELMKNIPDKSVDMVLTDPPFGITNCKWDSVIPFEPMWEQLKRITKDNGAICLFGSEPFSSHLRLSNLKMFKYDWIWQKPQPSNSPQCNRRPLLYHEKILIFYERQPYYLPIKKKGRPNHGDNTNGKVVNGSFGYKIIRSETKKDGMKFPKSIIEFNAIRQNKLHPTQKPIPLLEFLIRTYTLEGETVLDFTMGSGSTGVACKNLKRNFIGIEKDDKYFEIAKERINA